MKADTKTGIFYAEALTNYEVEMQLVDWAVDNNLYCYVAVWWNDPSPIKAAFFRYSEMDIAKDFAQEKNGILKEYVRGHI